MLRPVPRLGPSPACLALLLALACLVWPGQAPLAEATQLTEKPILVSVAVPQAPGFQPVSSPVPRPASRYALDADALGAVLPNLGAFSIDPHPSADDAVYICRSQASSTPAGMTTVVSTIVILSTDDQAEEKYSDTQKVKTNEHNVQFEGVSGWKADQVSTFQTRNTSGERVAGTLLRFRNAVALVEIRGSVQRVSSEHAKELMKKILTSLRDATGAAD